MKKVLISAVLISFTLQSFAQDSEVSEGLETALSQLLVESGALAMGEQMSELFVSQMAQGLRQSHPDLPPAAFEVIREETIAVINEELDRGSFQAMLIPIYAQFYTLEEVQELLAFYRSPIGRKTVEVLPALGRDSAQAGERWGMLVAPTIGARITRRLQEEGFDLD